jgi:hypothetical protein
MLPKPGVGYDDAVGSCAALQTRCEIRRVSDDATLLRLPRPQEICHVWTCAR